MFQSAILHPGSHSISLGQRDCCEHPTDWTELAQSSFNQSDSLPDCKLNTSTKWMVTTPTPFNRATCHPILNWGSSLHIWSHSLHRTAFYLCPMSPAACHSAYTGHGSVYQMAMRLAGFVSDYQLSCWCQGSNRQLMQVVDSQAERLRFKTEIVKITEKEKDKTKWYSRWYSNSRM